ncbi:MAG: L,D-transpeptidase [Planctomycetota bacterium]
MRLWFIVVLFVGLLGALGFVIYYRVSKPADAAEKSSNIERGETPAVPSAGDSKPAPPKATDPSVPAVLKRSALEKAIADASTAAHRGDAAAQARALTGGLESIFQAGEPNAWRTGEPLLEALRSVNEKLWYQSTGKFRCVQQKPAALAKVIANLTKQTPPVHVGIGLLAKMNRLADPNIVPGHKDLRVPIDSLSIRVFTKSYSLILYLGDYALDVFPIGIGKPETPTPIGKFEIVEIQHLDKYKREATRWVRPEDGKELYYGDAEYPFGRRFLKFAPPVEHYGIHGTDRDDAVGNSISHGCVRMFNSDVEVLASFLDPAMAPRISVVIE